MKRLLFVDDEQEILDGLGSGMRRFRKKWHSSFANGALAALRHLEEHPVDVVVSDMRMPGIDGTALLTAVKDRYPDAIRIVLSGYSEIEEAMRVVPVAHQFLSKPCPTDDLENVIERTFRLRDLVESERIRELVGSIQSLPAVPKTYLELTDVLEKSRVTPKHVAKVIDQDVALSSRVLQLVNSSFFAPAMAISSIELAVVRLGSQLIKNLALTAHLFESVKSKLTPPGCSLESLQAHAVLSSRVARKMFVDRPMSDDAGTAAMLHTIGKLVLATHLPESYAEVLDLSRESGSHLHLVEQEQFGVNHSEVGAYLLALWGLPYRVVEAVAHHRTPGDLPDDEFGVTGAVHVASALAHDPPTTEWGGGHCLNFDYIERMGVAQQLETWRAEIDLGLTEGADGQRIAS